MLYGTTYVGGSSNLGTVFRLNQDGSGYQVIKSFAGGNAANPVAPLIFGTNGVLYGTTQGEGDYAKGALFQIDPSGGGYQVVKSFQDGADGNQPAGALALGSDGMLYGMTTQGGMGSRGRWSHPISACR